MIAARKRSLKSMPLSHLERSGAAACGAVCHEAARIPVPLEAACKACLKIQRIDRANELFAAAWHGSRIRPARIPAITISRGRAWVGDSCAGPPWTLSGADLPGLWRELAIRLVRYVCTREASVNYFNAPAWHIMDCIGLDLSAEFMGLMRSLQ